MNHFWLIARDFFSQSRVINCDYFIFFTKMNLLSSLQIFQFFSIPSGIWSFSVIFRMTRHGFPTAKLYGGISFVTTLPAPITHPSPMVTPPQTTTLDASQQLSFIVIGFAYQDYKSFHLLFFWYYVLQVKMGAWELPMWHLDQSSHCLLYVLHIHPSRWN